MHIIFDNLIVVVFIFVLYPSLYRLLNLVYPNVGSVLMVARKNSFVVSFAFNGETMPLFLQKPRFVFLIYQLNTLNLLKAEMVLF